MTSKRELIEINRKQKDYYESRYEAAGRNERAANRVTNFWTRLRRRIQRHDKAIGVYDGILADHRRWLGDLTDSRVLDLGCFSGNALSIFIAQNCREYVGQDLSESAIGKLREKLREARLDGTATAEAGDFLENDFPDAHFDVIYAHSVLHHFRSIECVLEEMHRVLRPGGTIVSLDPLATEPLIRLARALYRPFQSDSDWEWPFQRKTFRKIEHWFELDKVQGYRGLSMLSLPLAILPFMDSAAQRLGRRGSKLERKLANRLGIPLWFCWLVALRLIKRDDAN